MLSLPLLLLGSIPAIITLSLTLCEISGKNSVRGSVRDGGRDMSKEGDLEDGGVVGKGW